MMLYAFVIFDIAIMIYLFMNTNHLLVAFRNRALGVKETIANWTHEIEYLYKRGVGIDEALHYLYFEKPSIEEFEHWVNEKETKLVPYQLQKLVTF